MKGLTVINSVFLAATLVALMFQSLETSKKRLAIDLRMIAYEAAIEDKKPALIKFYTIPGYDCDTSEIVGHCSKWNITQAEYDKSFFKEDI